jgi:hypothetical protein
MPAKTINAKLTAIPLFYPLLPVGCLGISTSVMIDGVAKSRQQGSYRAFPDARNTTCMISHLKKHDALYMTIAAMPSG